jgi:cold shock CspA family protein
MRIVGEVVKYSRERSYGFVRELRDHGSEVFFHISNVENRIVLKPGDVVTYGTVPNTRKPNEIQAVDIRLAERNAAGVLIEGGSNE